MNAADYIGAFDLSPEEAHEMYIESIRRLWMENSGDMWISVNEQQPELGQRVLCDVFDSRREVERVCICMIDGKRVRSSDGVLIEGVEPIAWMPLPRMWGDSQ